MINTNEKLINSDFVMSYKKFSHSKQIVTLQFNKKDLRNEELEVYS